jgi:uncharacterized NAD(P)/FAD-binding protein YdhS
MTDADVVIVGDGAAGAMVLAHLARTATAPMRVAMIDSGTGRLGTGTAYRTADDGHLLNVRAAAMSAWQDQPDHFTNWLAATGRVPGATGAEFVPRAAYGAYLSSVAYDAANGDLIDTRLIDGRASRLDRTADGWIVTVNSAAPITARQVVLAIGVEPPSQRWVPRRLRCSPRFIADPWRHRVLDYVDDADPVLIVGTGLTAVDVAATLARRTSRPIVATSRHGLLPAVHTVLAARPMPLENDELPTTAPALRHLVHARIRAAVADRGDWRPAIDGLRPHTHRIWRGLTAAGQADFLRHDLRRWENARHRMAPQVGGHIAALLGDGRLTIANDHPSVALALADPDSWIVNATGPDADLSGSADPLVQQLFTDGYVSPGPHRIGWSTTDDGQLTDPAGRPIPGLWTLGCTRRGQLLESTAVPEIRAQAQALAEQLTTNAVRVRRSAGTAPRSTVVRVDRYGLPLRTTAAAAEHFDSALARVLQVQSGAAAELDAAVAEDQGFAIAHAARALLAFDGVIDADPTTALLRAESAASDRADARTSSFVHAVAARVRHHDPTGLLAHISDFPRDALVVNACIPTIASGGATDVPQHAWAIVEGLAPAYGTDWWYLGMLAFVRQEQHRWDQAAQLADRSLLAEPAGGHAVHARAHVYYETGDHVAGLEWLDGWISGPGLTAYHRAHYSWHAALYELALERKADVWARFRAQLAPPAVNGIRALVDSASLLWRCHLFGVWPLPLPIGDVIGAVPDSLLRRPPTGFVAMHAALALAAAGDLVQLDALRRYAGSRPEPVFELVATLVVALTAYVTGDYARAARVIAGRTGEWAKLGGSDAQREVIDDTLLSALIHAGRCDDARTLTLARV